MLAKRYFEELGGVNSSRLLLGGLLADLSAELYTWVAQGDQKYPDATTILMRSDAFLARANSLF